HGAVVLRRLEVDGVSRARHRAQSTRDTLFQPIFIAHQDLLAPVLREDRNLLVRVIHRDLLLEEVFEGRRKADDERTDHAGMISREKGKRKRETAFLSVQLSRNVIVKAACRTTLIRTSSCS